MHIYHAHLCIYMRTIIHIHINTYIPTRIYIHTRIQYVQVALRTFTEHVQLMALAEAQGPLLVCMQSVYEMYACLHKRIASQKK